MGTRIMLVDDHAIFRMGLRALIDAQDDCEVVAEASTGEGALAHLDQDAPDMVVLDIGLAGAFNGLETARRMRAKCPEMAIIILSLYDDDAHVQEAINSGASAYVLKASDPEDVIRAIQSIRRGHRYLSPALSDRAIATFGDAPPPAATAIHGLSPRESEIMHHVARGRTSAEIGALLFISPRTVDTHRASCLRKLGLKNQAEVVLWAVRQGILSPDQ